MYNKIFTKILDSSIWLEPTDTRIVWITLLAAMDEDGFAHFSAVQNLANRANISLESTEKALDVLMSPDSNSADPDHDGRRIERVPGGFFILNAQKHREAVTRVVQREQTRKRVAKHRAKKTGKTECNANVTKSNALYVCDTDTVFDQYKNVSKEIWAEFEQHRKEIHKPLTDLARNKNLTVLNKLTPEQQKESVDTTIANRWTGLFPPKNQKTKSTGKMARAKESLKKHHERLIT